MLQLEAVLSPLAVLGHMGAGGAAAAEVKAVLCRAAWDRASAKPYRAHLITQP